MIRVLSLGDLPRYFGHDLKLLKRPKPTSMWWAQADEQVRAACSGYATTLLGCGLVGKTQPAWGWISASNIDVCSEDDYQSLNHLNRRTPNETVFMENVERIHFTTIQSSKTIVGILSYMYGDLSRAKVYASSNAGATKVADAISHIPAFSF